MTHGREQEDQAVKLALRIQGETTFTPQECRALYRLAGTVCGTWVELGSWCGRSFTVTALGLQPNSELVAIDRFDGGMQTDGPRHPLAPTPRWVFDHFLAAFHACEDLRPDCRFRFLKADTREAAAQFEQGTLDAVFIDADHRYDFVKGDIEAWLPKLRPGGLLVGHDYWNEDPGVVRAVDEVFQGRHQVIPDTRIWHLRTPAADAGKHERE